MAIAYLYHLNIPINKKSKLTIKYYNGLLTKINIYPDDVHDSLTIMNLKILITGEK